MASGWQAGWWNRGGLWAPSLFFTACVTTGKSCWVGSLFWRLGDTDAWPSITARTGKAVVSAPALAFMRAGMSWRFWIWSAGVGRDNLALPWGFPWALRRFVSPPSISRASMLLSWKAVT